MQILIFRGDIHVNGNGRDTYKFRASHPVMELFTNFYVEHGSDQRVVSKNYYEIESV